MATTQKERTAAASGITIIAPSGGQSIVLQSNGEENVRFGYDVRTSTFSRSDNDLVVESDNGGKVTVVDFFAVGAENQLPSMVLEDGTVVASADFLRAQSPDMDVSTAAGPAQASSTSGLAAYDDSTGSLLGGTDRLGSLGTDQWGQSSQQQETDAAQLVADATPNAAAAAGPTPTPGPNPGPVPPVALPYDARAVLFTQDATAAPMVGFAGVSVADASSITWHDAAFKDYFDVSIDGNGQLTLTLNQAGKDFLAAQGSNNAYGYITLTDASGVEYTVQVVLNQNDNVASKALDAETPDENGGYGTDGLKHGEWHQGQALTDGNLSSSDLADHIRFTGVVSGSSINAGQGYDIVYLGGLKGSNTVTADDGTVTVEQNGAGSRAVTTDGGANTISAESANVFLNVTGDSGLVMYAKNGSNTVETKFGDIKMVADSSYSSGVHAATGGTNTLTADNGAISLDVIGAGSITGVTTDATGMTKLTAGDDITINATSTNRGATGIANSGTTLVTSGGALTVTAANLEVTDSNAKLNATTAGVSNSGTMELKANSIDIEASTTGNRSTASGVVHSAGQTTIHATEGDVTISASRNSVQDGKTEKGAYGINTGWGGTNSTVTVESDKANVTIKADDNGVLTGGTGGSARSEGAAAVYMSSGDVDVNLNAKEGTVSLEINKDNTDPGSYAWGVNNTGNGNFSINAKQADIDATAKLEAKGLFVVNKGSENSVTADTVNINLYGKDSAIAMAMGNSTNLPAGKNTITALADDGSGQVNIKLDGGFVTAMQALLDGENRIEADHVNIETAQVSGWATGLSATGTAKNTIESGDVDMTLKGYTGVGMTAGATSTTTPTATNLVQGTGEDASFNMNLSGTGGQYSKVRGMEVSAGGQNTIKDFASVNIAGVSSGEAAAMYTSAGNSQNSIASTGDITLNMQSTGAIAYGAYASGGTNSLSAGGDVNITATSNIATGTTASGGFYVPNAYGLRAEAGGNNEITNADNVTITASNPGAGFASAMDAKSGGTNSIANVTGNVIVGGGNYGMQVDGAGSSNTISKVGGNVTVSGTASGMGGYRTSGGSNTITEVGGNVKIDAGSKGIAMDNWGSSTNTISHVAGNVDLYGSNGMYVFGYGGKNIVDDVKGSVTITGGLNMYSGSGAAEGNTVSNVAGNVTLHSTSGIFNIDTVSGKNSITNVGGDVTLTGAGTAIFTAGTNVQTRIADVTGNVLIEGQLTVDQKGETLIENVGKNVGIGALSVQNNGGSNIVRGVGGDVTIANAMAADTGKNEISGVQGNVFVNGGNNSYVAMKAANNGENSISAKGDVTVQTATYSSVTYGMQAETSGKNIISSDNDVTISTQNVNSSSGTATGVSATNSGSNTITAKGDVDISATGKTAYGVSAATNGQNTITSTGDITLNVQSTGSFADGVYATGGKNTLNAGGDASIISSGKTAYGMRAEVGGENSLTAENVTIHSVATTGNVFGLAGSDANSQNIINATGTVNIIAESHTPQAANEYQSTPAYGIRAKDGAINTVSGNDVNISTVADYNSAHGVYAWQGHNVINAEETVKIASVGNNQLATTGLYALGGSNTVTVGSGLDLSAENKIGEAQAMYARGAGAFNLIQAAQHSEGLEVRITVAAGQGKAAYAMYAEVNGSNQIIGSDKADFISIKGDIYGTPSAQNIISTGAGDDRVVLDGAVNGGGLTLEMGAGHDILTLKAATFTEFKGRYEAWLNALMTTGHGIESIEVIYNEAWSPEDIASLHTFFGGAAFQNVDVLFPEALHSGTEVHSDMGNVFHEGNFDGTLPGDGHSSHTFASTQDDVVRVHGDVSNTELTFAGGGHDTLSVAGNLVDAQVNTQSTYTGTLHVEADGLENTNMNLAGGTSNVAVHGGVDDLSSLVLGGGNDTLSIEGNFTGNATMGAGNDLVTLHGSAHGGMVDGGAGNDTLVGDAGNNILVGGTGFDVLTGGAGADTFVWKAGDAGTTGAPSTDVVSDFNIDEGDKLDLSGLLGDGAKDNLDNYLSVSHENGNTVLNISTSGDSTSGSIDQIIVLENSSLTAEQLMQHLLLTQQ